MTSTQTPHPSTEPSGRIGDTRIINHGAHRIAQVRTVDGWWNIEVR